MLLRMEDSNGGGIALLIELASVVFCLLVSKNKWQMSRYDPSSSFMV